MPNTHRLCSCGTPLIFTFAFPYKEWYCLNCGEASEFFNGSREEQSNKEIQLKYDLVNTIFKRIRRGLASPGCTHTNCKKCIEGKDRYHIQHITKGEKEKDILARKYLEKFVGIFN